MNKAEKNALQDPSQARSFEELAALQGVRPVAEFQLLVGHPSAEDESVEDFAAMLRE